MSNSKLFDTQWNMKLSNLTLVDRHESFKLMTCCFHGRETIKCTFHCIFVTSVISLPIYSELTLRDKKDNHLKEDIMNFVFLSSRKTSNVNRANSFPFNRQSSFRDND